MKTIELQWKTFNVNIATTIALAQSSEASYCGASSDSSLKLHFTNDAMDIETVTSAIQAHWDGITSDSTEATSYQSRDQIAAAAASSQAALVASATAKLTVLGLTAQEIAAIVGS